MDINLENGFVTRDSGLSLHIDSDKLLTQRGGAHQITYIPDNLEIIYDGANDVGHRIIVPKEGIQMTETQYRSALKEIETKEIN